MRYYVPELALGRLLPTQTTLEDKFGGLPWGLPPERWPLCRECGKPLTHLAQLSHHPERLDLGREGRSVLVFECYHNPGLCETWSAESGANAVLFLDPKGSVGGLAVPPESERTKTAVGLEARVLSWVAADDLMREEDYPLFFDSRRMVNRLDADEEGEFEAALESVYRGTKLGSGPSWLQTADEGPPSPYHFVAQFDSRFRFPGPVPEADAVGCIVRRYDPTVARWVDSAPRREDPRQARADLPVLIEAEDGSSYSAEAADFGDAGIGYLFVDIPAGPTLFGDAPNTEPSGIFFWQCT